MRSRAILILVVTIAVMFGVQCQQMLPVPEELIGVWVTKDPNYLDRPFEIKKNTVIFEQGLGSVSYTHLTLPTTKALWWGRGGGAG